MSDPSRKRSRKSKLTLRECNGVANEELNIVEILRHPKHVQKDQILPESSIKEETETDTDAFDIDTNTIQGFNVKDEVTDIDEAFSFIRPTIAMPSPMEFSVNVEVEEFDEEIAEIERLYNESMMKINKVDDQQDDKTSIALYKEDDEDEKDSKDNSYYSSLMGLTQVDYCHPTNPKREGQKIRKTYVKKENKALTEDDIVLAVATTSEKTTSKVDKKIEMHIKQYWGEQHVSRPENFYDNLIQENIGRWRKWSKCSNQRTEPLLFKCYICDKGFWHLNQFKEHLHEHPKSISVQLEIVVGECNFIAFMGKKPNLRQVTIHDGSKCPQCGMAYEDHIISDPLSKSPPYTCKYCSNFSTRNCSLLAKHVSCCQKYRANFYKLCKENSQTELFSDDFSCTICRMGCVTSDQLTEHLTLCHRVWSDIPHAFFTDKCQYCFIKILPTHKCPKRLGVLACQYCNRWFGRRMQKFVHCKNLMDNVSCFVCDATLKKSCMEISHLCTHSDYYTRVFRCTICESLRLFPDSETSQRHKELYHPIKKKNMRTDEDVIVPTKLIERIRKEDKKDYEYRKKQEQTLEEALAAVEKVPLDLDSTDIETIDDLPPKKLIKLEKDFETTNDIQQDKDIKLEQDDIEIIDDLETTCSETTENLYQQKKPMTLEDDDIEIIEDSERETVINLDKDDEEDIEHEVDPTENSDEPDQEKVIKFEKDDNQHEKLERDDLGAFNQVKIEKEDLGTNVDSQPALIKLEKDEFETNDDLCQEKLIKLEKNLGKPAGSAKNLVTELENELRMEEERLRELEMDSNNYVTVIKIEESDSDPAPSNQEDSIENSLIIDEPQITIKEEKTEREANDKLLKCKKCNYKGYKSELTLHKLTECCLKPILKSGSKHRTCTKCNCIFDRMKRYLQHFEGYHGLQKDACPQCCVVAKDGMYISHVNRHIKEMFQRMHLIEDTASKIVYSCIVCRERVKKDDFFSHWEKHLDLGPEKVDFTETTSTRQWLPAVVVLEPDKLALALVAIQDSSKKISCCVVCYRQFQRNSECKRHTIEHLLLDAVSKKTDDDALVCQLCGQHFPASSNYKSHMRDHANLPAYKCNMCNKSFSDSSNFTKHKKVHNISVHVCDICKRKFQLKESLINHLEIHKSSGSEFSCSQCHQSFPLEGYLRKHFVAKHSARYKFICVLCKTTFSCLRAKWDHMWEKHHQRKHKADCPVCQEAFRKFSSLTNHMKYMHQYNKNQLALLRKAIVLNDPVAKREVFEEPLADSLRGDGDDDMETDLVLI